MIGIGLPQELDDGLAQVGVMRHYLRAVEAAGYDSAWVMESPRILDPLALLSFAAAATTTLALGTGVLVLDRWDARRLGRSAAAVDGLSHGRVSLGVAIGGAVTAEDGGAVRAPGSRAEAFERDLRVMREAADGVAGMIGESVGSRRMPVLIGARRPAALRRAARAADGWICSAWASDRDFRSQLAVVDAELAPTARDGRTFRVVKRCYVALDQPESAVAAWFRLAVGVDVPDADVLIAGDAAEVARRLAELHILGADEIILKFVGRDDLGQAIALAETGCLERIG